MFNILLQVLDDGRLTDGHGRTVDFRNTVLVMTSNLGSQTIQALTESGESQQRIRDAVIGEVSQHFRPEFINRIDDQIVFEPLSQEQIAEIAKLQVAALNERLREQELSLELDAAAMQHVVEQGYDPVYGARPLKRAFQRLIENPLANAMLEHGFTRGSVIVGSWSEDGLQLSETLEADAQAAG